jgi:hypothetical protein
MTKADTIVHEDPVTIRTPVILQVIHSGEQCRIDGMRRPAIKNSNYSTHIDPNT